MEDKANNILQMFVNGEVGWLELDTSFTPYYESKELKDIEQYFVEHREGEDHDGWEACCLHGLGPNKTRICYDYGYNNEIEAPYYWTEVSETAPCATQFWKDFPAERFARVRFMKLKPGGHIGLHNDKPAQYPSSLLDFLLPINVAITHPDNCDMFIEGHGYVPWQSGKVFLVNILQNHKVINRSNEDRLHMIAQVHPGNRKQDFINLLVRSAEKSGYKV
jgi:hypothetical protein